MRMNLIVMLEGRIELAQHGECIAAVHTVSVVAFEGLDEGFCHAVGLRTRNRRRQRLEADLAGKRTRVARNVRGPVVGQPFNRLRRRGGAEACLHRLEHQVAHHVAGDATGGGYPTHRFSVAAVQGKGNPHSLPIVAGDLEPVRAPAPVTLTDRDPTIVTARIDGPASVPAQQQLVVAHDAVDTLVVDPSSPFMVTPPIDHGPRPSITVRGQRRDLHFDLGHQFGVIARSAAAPTIVPVAATPCPYVQVGARHTQDFTHDVHRSSPGSKGERAIHFRSRATSTASFRISASKVFLPSNRCSSRICRRAASSSAAGTTVSPAPTAVSAPTRSSLRQWNTWFGLTPCWRATSDTVMPGSYVSRTIDSFSLADQRRRRSLPSTSGSLLLRLVIDTAPCLSLRISEKSCPENQGAISGRRPLPAGARASEKQTFIAGCFLHLLDIAIF